jgi:hypothetical protein
VIENSPGAAVASPPLDVSSAELVSEVAAAELDSASATLLDSSEVVEGTLVVVVAVVVAGGGGGGVTVGGVPGGMVVVAGGGAGGSVVDVDVVVDSVVVVAVVVDVGVVVPASVCPHEAASRVNALTQPSRGRVDKEGLCEVNFMGILRLISNQHIRKPRTIEHCRCL